MRAYFSRFGTVTTAEVKRTPEGRSRGFGFINFAKLAPGAEDDLFSSNPHTIDGRAVDVLPPRPTVRVRGAGDCVVMTLAS
jgi:hypothetical protein